MFLYLHLMKEELKIHQIIHVLNKSYVLKKEITFY